MTGLLFAATSCGDDDVHRAEGGVTELLDAGDYFDGSPWRPVFLSAPPGGGDASSVLVNSSTSSMLRWVGRVDLSNALAPTFSWTGAGFIGTFLGPEVAVALRTSDTDVVYFQTVVDGEPGLRFAVESGADQVVTVARGLAPGPHDIEVYRDTEGLYGRSTFVGVVSGTPIAAAPSNDRLIEDVGDSISAGFGNLGSEKQGDTSSWCAVAVDPSDSSWFATYAAVAGRAFGAEVSTIAREAWGLYRGATGSTAETLPSIYDDMFGSETTVKYTFPRQASAVVINLGTNDWRLGDPGVPFEEAYERFLEHVRDVYPRAWIVMSIGSMLDAKQRAQVMERLHHVLVARAALGDTRMSTLDLGTEDPAVTGCLGHPDVSDNQRMAALLQAELSARLGW